MRWLKAAEMAKVMTLFFSKQEMTYVPRHLSEKKPSGSRQVIVTVRWDGLGKINTRHFQ